MLRGLLELTQVERVCDSCLVGKQHRTPFLEQAKWWAESVLELINGDLCGLVTPATPSGNKYFLLLVGDMSRYMWLWLLSSKDQTPSEIKNFQAAECQLTAPYSPQHNGVVEQRNQSVVAMARCMLKVEGQPGYFWGEAVSTVVHILNRSLMCALDGTMSYEAWHGEVPAIHYFHTFSCITHLKITQSNLKKLDDQSHKAIFIGYEAGSKAYCFYNPIDQRVIISHDVVFKEARLWCLENADGDQAGDPESLTMEYNTEIVWDLMPATPSATPPLASPHAGEHAKSGEHEPEVDEEDLDVDHDDTLFRAHAIDDLIGDAEPPGLARRMLEAELNFTSAEEPASFNEAEQEAA
jgi:hypothetical protein